ncbi:MAG: hypothetical protein FWF52_05690 [Candidatus Azobacteroides sp.]|nr:hypothetical protein [Candidatus Azobacteroides sp.]
MKTLLLTALLYIFAFLDFSSCNKEVLNEMPPETQTGANTLGCLIDGELFVGGCCTPWMTPPFNALYNTVSDKLYLSSYGKVNVNNSGCIDMEIYHPIQNNIQTNALMFYYSTSESSTCVRYLTSTNREVFITKLDTVNKIVSGRFQFTGYCSNDDSANTKQITQGRFDLKLNIDNN